MKLNEILVEMALKRVSEETKSLLGHIQHIVKELTDLGDEAYRKTGSWYHAYLRPGYKSAFIAFDMKKDNSVELVVKNESGYDDFPVTMGNDWWGGSLNLKIYPGQLGLAKAFIERAYENSHSRPTGRAKPVAREIIVREISQYYRQNKDSIPPAAVQRIRADRENIIREILAQRPYNEEGVRRLVADQFAKYTI